MRKFNIAVIGCGRISYKAIEGILNNREVLTLTATCDIVLEKAEGKKKAYLEGLKSTERVNTYVDYKEMLHHEEIDIIYIATESGYHGKIAMEVMKAGKHVIVEKPMALSLKECEAMIACAEENNVKLGVCHQNRFNEVIQKLRGEIDNNSFGKIINGTARILWTRDMEYYKQAPWRGTYELDGGTLMNQCIHNIDLLQWMMNSRVKSVYAQCDTFLRDIDAEDFGAIVIRFENGAVGIVEGSACVYPKNLEETLSIFGEKATVCIGGLAVNRIETWRIQDSKETEAEVLNNQKGDPENVYGYGHTALFRNFIEAIINNEEPLINGREGMKPVEIILAAYKSSATGQAIQFPLKDFSTVDMKNLMSK